jgi:hypothetical protein
MAQKSRWVRRVDERNDNLKSGGGALITSGQVTIRAPGIIQPPSPEDITVGTQTLLRTTLVPKVLVNVSWGAPVNLLPESYLIEYAKDVDFTVDVQRATTTLTSVALEMLPDTDYWIRVSAVIRGMYSEEGYPSNYPSASIHTIDDTTPPGPISGLSIITATGDFQFQWTNPTSSNFFETRIRLYDVFGGTLYKEVFIVGNPGSISRYIFTVEENEQVSSGAFLTSVYYEILAYSLAGVPALTTVSGTATKAVPTKPTGLATSWDSDNGTFDEGVVFSWTAQTFIKDYTLKIDGFTKNPRTSVYTYNYTENVGDHRPTLISGDYSLAYTVQARDRLNQVSPGASGTATNLAPTQANVQLTTAVGFTSLYAYITHPTPIQDLEGYIWTLTSGTGITSVVKRVVNNTPDITFTTLKGTYGVSVQAFDKFGRTSIATTVSGLVLDGLTIEELRSEAKYTDSINSSAITLDALKDGVVNSGGITYSASASAWRWTQVERAVLDRYKTITVSVGNVSAGTLQIYLAFSNDGNTWNYYSGPLVSTGVIAGNTTLTSRASEALAQSNALSLTLNTVYRLDLPALIEARYIVLYHRNTTGSYTFREYYPRRLIQADDIEAESIKSINIAAAQIIADHISVLKLSAVSSNIGQLVIDTGGYIFQGTGTPSVPTTALMIDNSGGIGRLRTFNGGTLQVQLDTDGKLKAGAGSVFMDSTGIVLNVPSSQDNNAAIKWKNGSTIKSLQYTIDTGTLTQHINSTTSDIGDDSEVIVEALTTLSADTSTLKLFAGAAGGGTSGITITQTGSTGNVSVDTDVDINGTISAGNSPSKIDMKDIGSIANNGVAQVSTVAADFCVIIVIGGSSVMAMYALRGGVHVTNELFDATGAFSGVAGTAGTNIYWSAGNSRYEIENKTGGSVTYRAIIFRF